MNTATINFLIKKFLVWIYLFIINLFGLFSKACWTARVINVVVVVTCVMICNPLSTSLSGKLLTNRKSISKDEWRRYWALNFHFAVCFFFTLPGRIVERASQWTLTYLRKIINQPIGILTVAELLFLQAVKIYICSACLNAIWHELEV